MVIYLKELQKEKELRDKIRTGQIAVMKKDDIPQLITPPIFDQKKNDFSEFTVPEPASIAPKTMKPSLPINNRYLTNKMLPISFADNMEFEYENAIAEGQQRRQKSIAGENARIADTALADVREMPRIASPGFEKYDLALQRLYQQKGKLGATEAAEINGYLSELKQNKDPRAQAYITAFAEIPISTFGNRAENFGKAVGYGAIGGIKQNVDQVAARLKLETELLKNDPEYARLAMRRDLLRRGEMGDTTEELKIIDEILAAKLDKAYEEATGVTDNEWLRKANVARENASYGLTSGGKFLMDTGISAGSFGANLAVSLGNPNVALGLMAAQAGGQEGYQIGQEGGGLKQQMQGSIAAGVLEALTEKLPLDKITKAWKTQGAGGLDRFIKAYVKGAVPEGGEEFVNTIAGNIMHSAVMGTEADLNSKEWWKQTIEEALTSMAAGGITGGAIAGLPAAFRGKTINTLPEPLTNRQKELIEPPIIKPQKEAFILPINGQTQSTDSQTKTEPVQVGKATTIYHPYEGQTPVMDDTVTRTTPMIGENSLNTAISQIESATRQAETTGKSFRNFLSAIYNDWFDKSGGARNIAVDGLSFNGERYLITLGKKVIRKVISDKNLNPEKLAVFDVIDSIVQNSEYVGSGKYVAKSGRIPKNVIRYDYFETPVKINGQDYLVTFDVEVLPDINRYRTHKVINSIDLKPTSSVEADNLHAAQDVSPGLSTNTIAQNENGVNTSISPKAQGNAQELSFSPAATSQQQDFIVSSTMEKMRKQARNEDTQSLQSAMLPYGDIAGFIDQVEKISEYIGENPTYQDLLSYYHSIGLNGKDLKQEINDAFKMGFISISKSGKYSITPAGKEWKYFDYDANTDMNNSKVINKSTNQPISVEAENILTKLANDENIMLTDLESVPEITEARQRIGTLQPTSEINTPERAAIRQDILQNVKNMGSANIDNNGKVAYNGIVRQDKRADIVIGLPAAGKSSVLADHLSQKHQSRIIDSDMVKEMLPEFDNGYGAGRVHEESKKIASEWFDTSVLNGYNVVYPIVGSNLQKVLKTIEYLKANGYSVHLHLNELSNNKATGRAIKRFFETGRFVDPALVMEYGNKPSQVYDEIRQLEGYIDGYSRYSNDVPYGQQPKLLERSEDLSDNQGDVRRSGRSGLSNGKNERTAETKGTAGQKIAGDEPAFSMGNNNADSAEALIEKYGAIPPGENASRNIMIPQETGQGHVRRFYRTAAEAKGTPDDMVDNIIDQSLQDSYIPIADKKAQEYADRTIAHYGHNGALEKWNSVVNGERHVTKEELALGEKLYLDAANAGDTKTAMKLLAEVAAEGTRAGQVVQAIRMIKKMTPAGQLYYVSKVVDGVNKDLAKRIKKGKAKYVKVNEHLANKLLKAQNQEQIDAAVMDIYADIGKQMPNTWVDKWNAWRYLSMLGNPRTHIRNIIGNGIFYPVRRLSNAIAAGMEKTVTLLPMAKDMERTRSVLVKGKKSDEALKSWAAKDYEENKAAIFAGGKYNPSDIIRDNQEIFRIRLLEKARKLNTSLLDKEDMWVSRPTYIKTLAGYLKANGLTPDTATPQQLEKARTFAIQESQKASFRETNAFANSLSRFSRQGKAQALLIEGVLPFKKTPLNILKQGTVEYSPVGFVKSMYDAAINIRNGNKTAAEVIGEFSKGLTGTGLVALGAYLTAQGLLNGLGDDDEKQAQLDKLKGLQNYSLQIGDMSYTIDWAAPGILPLFVGAELYHYMHNNDERVTFSALLDGMSRITEPMIENSMLSGLNSTLKAGAYEDDMLTSTVGSVLMNYLGQGVPTLFGQVARTIDPVRRNTYDVNKNSALPAAVQKFGKKQMAKLPGLSMMLEPSIDEWGREKTYAENIGLRAVENFLSPGYISMKKEDKATMETERLYQKTGDSSVLPTFAPKYFTFNNKRIDLSGQKYTEFAKKKGQTAYQTITSIMQDSRYKKLSDSKKAEAIADAQYYATVSAKRSIEPNYGDETWVQKAMEAEKAGILPKTYIFIKNAVDQDGSGRPSKKEAINILSKNYGLSKKQKAVMFHLLCPTVKENPFS